ncbi:unnamed protein product [Caenorhabditis bovis]|uniref:Innexin n=1 Tax=Caenorhabditis bovis TaxID=2654633 RepID=A0A8S1FDV1_9PELO|nr:unnamed protein product [Caenorhabditis bovis]
MPRIPKFKLLFFGNNHIYDHWCNNLTTSILLAFALILFIKNHNGTPIKCVSRIPYSAQFATTYNRSAIEILKSKCWKMFENNLYLIDNKELKISEYGKFGDFLMLISAMQFVIVRYMFKNFEAKIGSSLSYYWKTTKKIKNVAMEKRAEKVKRMSRKIIKYNTIKGPNELFYSFITVKFLYLALLTWQSFAFNFLFISEGFHGIWGFKALYQLCSLPSNGSASLLPHQAICRFDGHPHLYFSCFLEFNALSEILYALLSIWMTFMIVMIILDIVKFVWNNGQDLYVKKFLNETYNFGISDSRIERMKNYLGFNGFVIIKIVFDVSESVSHELIQMMALNEIAIRYQEEDDDIMLLDRNSFRYRLQN